jgi:hypothetical protein
MSEVSEAMDPKQLAQRDKVDQPSQLHEHAHQLMSECHLKNTSGHAAEWWKKAHASAIQAMPDEIKSHDSVKGQVGTTLWDIAHASLESHGQKGSVAHEMKRIADLNHISVDCSDLRNKEIRLHEHHAKPVEAKCPPKEVQAAPLPPVRPAELLPPAPLPPVRPAETLPLEPRVIMAPDFVDRDRHPHSRERYDVLSSMPPPIERCHQPNLLDLANPLNIIGSLIPFGRRDMECRLPPPDGNYDYYRREHRGYGHERQFGGVPEQYQYGQQQQYLYGQEGITAPPPRVHHRR